MAKGLAGIAEHSQSELFPSNVSECSSSWSRCELQTSSVRFFHAMPAKAASPVPKVTNVPGSGTEVEGIGATTVPPLSEVVTERPPLKPLLPERIPEQVLPMVFICKDTCPVLARALPQSSVAPVFMLMLVSARMFPSNAL
jgi:hypothetical protein